MLVNDENFTSQDETRILHPSSRMLFRFWETMRAERSAPTRAELDLKFIRPLVSQLYISEYAPQLRKFKWRLAGTGLCELYRCELTGGDMLADWDSFETDVIGRYLRGTMEHHQPSVFRTRFTTDRDQTVGAEMVALPLLSADGSATHIFGGVFPFREIWSLGYGAITRMELTGARSIWTENIPVPLPDAIAPPIRRNRGFRVIAGGRDGE